MGAELTGNGDAGARVAIVAGLRTPFTKAGSELAAMTSVELGRRW